MKALRSRLTYANVVATLALFLALGGAAYAGTQLSKNSVGTKQLKNNAVTAAKIKKGTITGDKINLSSLGVVPSATSAGNAQTLGGLSAAQITAASKLTCPAGTKLGGGVCFEEAERPPAQILLAQLACAKAGMRLPSTTEIMAFGMKYFTSPPPYNWADLQYTDNGTFTGVKALGYGGSSPNIQIGTNAATAEIGFRCVTPPTS